MLLLAIICYYCLYPLIFDIDNLSLLKYSSLYVLIETNASYNYPPPPIKVEVILSRTCPFKNSRRCFPGNSVVDRRGGGEGASLLFWWKESGRKRDRMFHLLGLLIGQHNLDVFPMLVFLSGCFTDTLCFSIIEHDICRSLSLSTRNETDTCIQTNSCKICPMNTITHTQSKGMVKYKRSDGDPARA